MMQQQQVTSTVTFTLLCLMLCAGGGGGGNVYAFCPPLAAQKQIATTTSSLSLVPGQGIQLVAAYNAASCKKQDNGDDNVPQPTSISAGDENDDDDVVKASRMDATTVTTTTTTDEPSSSSSHWRALASSRSFVSRLFHIPSSAIKSHPHPDMELIQSATTSSSSSMGGTHNPTFPFNFIPTRPSQHQEPASVVPSTSFSSSSSSSENHHDNNNYYDDNNNNNNGVVDTVLYPIVGFRFVTTPRGDSIALPTICHAACTVPYYTHREDVVGWYNPVCKLDIHSEDICHKP
jgi:hypothetical protein